MSMTEKDREKWHKGSRTWMGLIQAQYLTFILTGWIFVREAEVIPQAIGMWVAFLTLAYGGSAVVNYRERNPEFIQAVAEKERQERAQEAPQPSRPIPGGPEPRPGSVTDRQLPRGPQ